MSDAPVFIVGMNGSGTTMLADSLGKHSALYILPIESKVLPYFIQTNARFGDLAVAENRQRLANAMGASMPYWYANGKLPLQLAASELDSCRTFGEVVQRVYANLAAKHGKTRWGDKSPMNVQHIGAIARALPEAKFIHMVRDGRDCAQSFHRRWGFHPRRSIWRWKQAVRDGRRQGSALGDSRYLEVRYESLTTASESEMRRICAFLDLSFEPSLLESSMRFLESGKLPTAGGRMIPNSEKWRNYFTEKQIARLEELAGMTLSEQGYQVVRKGDADLRRTELRWLWLRDSIVRAAHFFQEYDVLRVIPRFVRHVAAALKQRSANRY